MTEPPIFCSKRRISVYQRNRVFCVFTIYARHLKALNTSKDYQIERYYSQSRSQKRNEMGHIIQKKSCLHLYYITIIHHLLKIKYLYQEMKFYNEILAVHIINAWNLTIFTFINSVCITYCKFTRNCCNHPNLVDAPF